MNTPARDILLDMEAQLKALELWQSAPVSVEALASQQPFCVDTLTFPQWLQFVFIPRLHALLDGGHPLPHGSGVFPMAMQYFSESNKGAKELLMLIHKMDGLLGRANYE